MARGDIETMAGEARIMKSRNFDFLSTHNRELAELGGFAERYAHSDPASALVKLRMFGENLVADFFQHYKIPRLPQANFLELLQVLERESLAPPVVLNKLHVLRSQGNRAAHGSASAVSTKTVMWILRDLMYRIQV